MLDVGFIRRNVRKQRWPSLYFYIFTEVGGWRRTSRVHTYTHSPRATQREGRVIWQCLAGAVKWDSPPAFLRCWNSPEERESGDLGGTPICMIRLLHLSRRKPTSGRCRERTALRAEEAMQGPPPEYAFLAQLKQASPLVSEERLLEPGASMARQEFTDPALPWC